MLFQPTELSYLSEVTSSKSGHSLFSHHTHLSQSTKVDDDFYNKKIKGNMVNNIFREINAIKKKEVKEKVNYISLLQITEQEYNQAQLEITGIIDSLYEEHLVEIQTINRPTNLEKKIFECFSYLIGEPYFEFKAFKEKINLYELKYKMVNKDFDKIEMKKVNYMLNLLAKNEKMSLENLENELPVLEIIFKWVQNVLKMYLYKVQNKMLSNHKRNRSMNSLQTSKSNLSNMKENDNNSKKLKDISKGNQLDLLQPIIKPIIINNSNKIKNNELENIKEVNTNSMNATIRTKKFSVNNDKNSEVFFTDLKNGQGKISQLTQQKSSRANSNQQQSSFRSNNYYQKNTCFAGQVKEANNYNIELKGFDIGIEQRKSLIKTLESVTFIKHKTFHQLRKHFGTLINPKREVSHQHVDDIWGSSLQNPKNINLMLQRFASGHIKGLDYQTLGRFNQNLRNEEYFQGPNWYKK